MSGVRSGSRTFFVSVGLDWRGDGKRGGARSTLAEHDRGNVRDFHRFTRLTNAFSKKLENHAAMVALYFMYYNFGRVHQTLRVTPAMEAGLADHVWAIEEIVSLL